MVTKWSKSILGVLYPGWIALPCTLVQVSDAVAKQLKHSTVHENVPGLNPTCCFAGKMFCIPLLPLEDQPLAERTWRFKVCFSIVCHGVWCFIILLWIWFNRSTFVTVDSYALKCQILFHKYPNPWKGRPTNDPVLRVYVLTSCANLFHTASVYVHGCCSLPCPYLREFYPSFTWLIWATCAGLHLLHSDSITDSEQGLQRIYWPHFMRTLKDYTVCWHIISLHVGRNCQPNVKEFLNNAQIW